MAAYALILSVMQSGTATSYVGAVREINVVFGTIAAVIILKEKVTPMRLLGSVLISAGVAIIAIWG
jgi:drug/metabolite transporter (DMT)-like permease